MPTLALSPNMVVALVFVAVFAVVATTLLGPRSGRRHRSYHRSQMPRRAYHASRRLTGPRQAAAERLPAIAPDLSTARQASDPVSQLRAVMTGNFTAKTVLSYTEAKVLTAAEAAIAEAGLPWRVLAQVALGEVLGSDDEAAFRAINAKRVDLLIVSERRLPLAAIEYQGEGHWQGEAPARDAVKKEALRRAGVGYIEITPRDGPADVRREIGRLAMDRVREQVTAKVATPSR